MTVDFHVHSTASDGSESPSAVVRAARGFDALAITDHDTTEGLAEAFATGAACGVRVIAGVELDALPGAGFDTFHLLGIGIDPNAASFQAFLTRTIASRDARNAEMIANFNRLGIALSQAALAPYAQGTVLARPHVALWLVANGYAATVREAFARYLLADAPAETRCYAPRWRPAAEEAIAQIHAAGGRAVMAHPKYLRRDWRTSTPDYVAVRRELMRLKSLGLDGLEALYRANSMDENIAFVRLADELHLLKSVGSDFHGTPKPDIALGMTVDEDFIAPLLEAL